MPRHPLFDRLIALTAAVELTPATVAAFEAGPGTAVLLFAGDPVRFPEGLDLAVVLPELHARLGPFRVGLVPARCEDELARRHAVRRWPSLVFMRDGGWLGTLAGMKDWDDFVAETRALLAATPGARPQAVIPIHAGAASACA